MTSGESSGQDRKDGEMPGACRRFVSDGTSGRKRRLETVECRWWSKSLPTDDHWHAAGDVLGAKEQRRVLVDTLYFTKTRRSGEARAKAKGKL